MGMFGDIASSIGGAVGSGKAAKGWDKAEDLYKEMHEKALDNREYMDPFGTERRKEAGDQYWEIMNDPSKLQTTGQYQFVKEEALRAAMREGAASGYGVSGASSGNVAAALADRASGLASKEYTSIMDRLQNLSGANASYGQQAGQTYSGVMQAAYDGQAMAKVGKYNQYANMQQQGHSAIGNIADAATSFGLSDAKLKSNLTKVGTDGSLNVYTWEWNKLAEERFGLTGTDKGYVAQEVKRVMPEAVTTIDGFLAIDYGYLSEVGVQ